MKRTCRLAFTLMLIATPAAAQVSGPVAPALTPDQITSSQSLAPKFDESAAREKSRLETFVNRPLGAIIQRSFNVFSNYLVMAAEMMPESGYAFRPTPDLRTFGQQINHATGAHYSFCNQAGTPPGVQKQAAPALAAITAKPAIIAALKESIAYCNGVLAAASEAWLSASAAGARRFVERSDSRHARTCVHLQRRAQRRRLRDDHDVSAHAGRRAAVDARCIRSRVRLQADRYPYDGNRNAISSPLNIRRH